MKERSIVDSWRVLAVVAEPPEANPGEDVTFTAMVVNPEGERVRVPTDAGVAFEWRVCVRPEVIPGLSGITYNPEQGSGACGGEETLPVMLMGDGLSATMPGAITNAAISQLDEVGDLLGEFLSVEDIEALLATTGFTVTGELTVRDQESGAPLVVAFKRATITTREQTGTNPPPVRLRVGEHWVSATAGDDPFRCDPEDEPPSLPVDEEVTLAPDEDDDEWRENYFILTLTGEIQEATERPFYSWFSTGGTFDQEVTRAPIREELWVTPKEPGDVPLWVVVRDGHGGTSACEVTVTVE